MNLEINKVELEKMGQKQKGIVTQSIKQVLDSLTVNPQSDSFY